MSFKTLQKNLRAEGWFVEWNMPCCQSCAWADVEPEVGFSAALCGEPALAGVNFLSSRLPGSRISLTLGHPGRPNPHLANRGFYF